MKKVLIIEDDKTVRSGLQTLMKSEGFEVFSADNGTDGLELANTHLPDIILCDIAMPQMNGYDVLAALRSTPATATIPLIFLTAKVMPNEEQKGLEMGANAYLKKPMWPEDIMNTVKKFVSA